MSNVNQSTSTTVHNFSRRVGYTNTTFICTYISAIAYMFSSAIVKGIEKNTFFGHRPAEKKNKLPILLLLLLPYTNNNKLTITKNKMKFGGAISDKWHCL